MKIKLYAEGNADNFLNNLRNSIVNKINNEDENYILNVGVSQFAEYLKDQFTLNFPVIEENNVFVSDYERDVSVEDFPYEFRMSWRTTNKRIKKNIIVYNLPYTGAIELLRYQPNTYTSLIGMELNYDSKSCLIKIEVIDFYNDAVKIKKQYEEQLSYIKTCYNYLKNDVENFNSSLENFIISTLHQRRSLILKKRALIDSLGVPVKSNPTAPKTFSVPSPHLRAKISIKPCVTEQGFKPEPTLDEVNYLNILKIINDIGKNFERYPSVYADKGEENLRDHILLILDPNFENGSASGETFNKKGKTDILLRYDSSVVFVAECKFWAGEKKYLETIDQILGYLTWRDSKTSIVVFVNKKDMVSVLETVKAATKKHAHFIKESQPLDESWFNYIFSLPIDRNKEIRLAVQLYHIP